MNRENWEAPANYRVTMDFKHCAPPEQLLPGTFHDMKNQLMMMKSAYSLYTRYGIKNRGHYCDIFCQSADNLCEMLNMFSKTTEEQRNGLISINRLVQDFRPALSALSVKSVEHLFSLNALPDIVCGNTLLIKNSLMNLTLNALHFTPEGGRILTSTFNRSNMVCLSVRDNGEGIRPENLRNIFTPHFSTRPEGKGLGLPMVLSTITKLGGFIRVCTTPGEGSEFILFLPTIAAQPAISSSTAIGIYG